MLRTIIPGPPGTGKTHRLMYYLEHELKQTDPSKIAYIAFSNAAADEAYERIKHPLLYISTLHHLGTRECNIDTTTQLLKDRKLTTMEYERLMEKANSWQNIIRE